MPTRVRHAALVCSVLLGALVISCGGPPGYAIGPASPPAAERAPEAAPAPVAPAAPPAPVFPRGRPGGAPPGAELVELPGGDRSPLERWLSNMHIKCEAAHYGQNCLNLHIHHTTKGTHKNCIVEHQNPSMGTRVRTSTPVTLSVTCEPSSEPMKSGGSSSTETGTKKGHPGT